MQSGWGAGAGMEELLTTTHAIASKPCSDSWGLQGPSEGGPSGLPVTLQDGEVALRNYRVRCFGWPGTGVGLGSS